MRKNVKKRNIRIGFFLMTTLLIGTIAGCKKKTEVVITAEGEDITEVTTEYSKLEVSKATKFSYEDLVVGSLKYMTTEDDVKKALGNPVSSYESTETLDSNGKSEFAEHVLSYNELTLIFMPFDGVYKLTAAASVSSSDTFARGIKVGDQFDDILNLYYRETDCMNTKFYTQDQSSVIGRYLYGNFTIDDLETVKTSDPINYGVINYNGYTSIESAESYIVEFTSFDTTYKDKTATVNDDFAQLAFDINNSGEITGIRWYYYPEVDN